MWDLSEREKMTPEDRYQFEKDLLQILSVTFEQNSYEQPQQYILSNLTEFTAGGLKIHLNFSDPIFVS